MSRHFIILKNKTLGNGKNKLVVLARRPECGLISVYFEYRNHKKGYKNETGILILCVGHCSQRAFGNDEKCKGNSW